MRDCGASNMEIRIIKSEEQRQRALAEIERLMGSDPAPESSEGSRLEVLAKLVEDFEKAHFPIENCDPVDAITFRMEEGGLKQKDIAHLLGGKNRASEVLSRKRPLTLPMIRSLNEKLGIPLEVLIRERNLRRSAELNSPLRLDRRPRDVLAVARFQVAHA